MTSDDHYGFNDELGRVCIPPIYDFALPFSEGLAVVSIGGKMGIGKTGFIAEDGSVAIDFIYDGARSFSEGLAQVELVQNGEHKTGYIDHYGRLVIPMDYNFAMSFRDGVAPVCVGESWVKGKYGCIDTRGEIVIPLKFDYLEPYSLGLFIAKYDGKWYLIDLEQKDHSPKFNTQKDLSVYLNTTK